MNGLSCKLFKKCRMCRQTKYLLDFPSKGSGRRSYCKSCKPVYKFLKSLYPEWKFKDEPVICTDVSILEVSQKGFIFYQGKGKRWLDQVTYEKAVCPVQEGAARVLSPTKIEELYDHDSFHAFIKGRDDHTCQYCGNFGNTIDHVVPKSKGGLKIPLNCVCACYKCNQLKGDQDIDVFLEQYTWLGSKTLKLKYDPNFIEEKINVDGIKI